MIITLQRCVRLGLFVTLALAASAPNAFATHFRGVTMWYRVPDPAHPNVVEVHVSATFRWDYSNWDPTIGTAVNVGTLSINENPSLPTTFYNVSLVIVAGQVNPVLDEFTGTSVLTVVFPTSPATYTYTVELAGSSRLSTLLNGNHDTPWKADLQIPVDMTAAHPNNSPVVNGMADIHVLAHQSTTFKLGSWDPDGDPVTFRIASSTESSLVTPVPCAAGTGGSSQPPCVPILTLQTDGTVTFTPDAEGIYALQVIATDGKGASVPFDFLMSSVAPYTIPKTLTTPAIQTTPPILTINGSPTPSTLTVPAGSTINIPIVAQTTGPDVNAATLTAGMLPDGASITPGLPVSGDPVTAAFSWTPRLDQAGSYVIAVEASDSNGNFTTSWLTLNVDAQHLTYLMGTLRDFGASTPDFSQSEGDNGIPLVAPSLGPDGRPVFGAAGTATTIASAASFANWWSGAGEAYPVLLSGLNQASGVFSAQVQNFASTHQFFTFEAHTSFHYTPGMQLSYSSSDDMWVFINGSLAVDLGGVHASPRTVTLDTDAFAAAHALVPFGIYPMDIFYAHRGAADTSSIQLQTSDTTACDPVPAVPAIPLSTLHLVGSAQTANGGATLSLSSPGAYAWTPTMVDVGGGFEADFTFTMARDSGLALVLQSAGQDAAGISSAPAGYAGIPDSIAIALYPDGYTTYRVDSIVSIHTLLSAPNSFLKSAAIAGSSSETAGVGPVMFDDGARHAIKVTYLPGAALGSQVGWFRVYLDGAPMVQGPIADSAIAAIFPGGRAYVGFTGSSTASVLNFAFGPVQASSATTGLLASPAALMFGQTGTTVVRARDLCADPIALGGASIAATLTNGGASTPVTVADNGDGTYALSYTPADAGNWMLDVTLGGTGIYGSPFTVSVKRQPAVAVTGGTSVYDGQPHAATGSAIGAGGVDLGPLTFTYNGGAAPPVEAGTYTVVGTFGGDDQYVGGSASATITIDRAMPTVTAAGGTFTYDGAAHQATGSVTGVGAAALAPPTLTYNGSATLPVDAGAYLVIASFGGNQDYLPAASAPATLTINQATPTITVTAGSFTYDGAPHPATGSVAGIHGAVIGVPTFTYDGLSSVPVNAGGYTVVASFGGNQDYTSATSAPVTLTIARAAPGLSWPAPAGIVYGAPLSAAQLDAVAAVPGSFSYAPPAGAVLGAGPQVLQVTFTPGDSRDYDTASTSVSLPIARTPLTIAPVSQSALYGAGPAPLVVTYAGFVNGDTAAGLTTPAAITTTATAASHVGTYPILVSGATSPNYAIAFAAGTVTVVPAPLTIRANDVSMVAGAALPTLTAAYSGFVNGDTDASLTSPAVLTTTATAASGPGTYPITVSGAASHDYTIAFVGGTLTVLAPAQVLQAVQATIAGLAGGGAAGAHAGDAARALSRALDPSNWTDAAHLASHGMPVFNDIRQAFDALAAIRPATPGIVAAEGNLVAAARELDVTAGADVTQGDADLAAGHPDSAIQDYKQAWQRAHRLHLKRRDDRHAHIPAPK